MGRNLRGKSWRAFPDLIGCWRIIAFRNLSHCERKPLKHFMGSPVGRVAQFHFITTKQHSKGSAACCCPQSWSNFQHAAKSKSRYIPEMGKTEFETLKCWVRGVMQNNSQYTILCSCIRIYELHPGIRAMHKYTYICNTRTVKMLDKENLYQIIL